MKTSFFVKIDKNIHWIHGGVFISHEGQISIFSPFMSTSPLPLNDDVQKDDEKHVQNSQR